MNGLISHFKVPPCEDRGVGNMDIAPPPQKSRHGQNLGSFKNHE